MADPLFKVKDTLARQEILAVEETIDVDLQMETLEVDLPIYDDTSLLIRLGQLIRQLSVRVVRI